MLVKVQPPPRTYRDLRRLPEDRLRHELIGGEHFMSPSPAVKHQVVVMNLGRILSGHARAHKLGTVLVGPVDVVFTESDVVVPDVVYVGTAHAERVHKLYIAGAPDLVVEVLSPSGRARDRIKKRRLYRAHGVPEYWIVDPAAETVEVYRAEFPVGLSAAAGDVLGTPLLPGLQIPLHEIFN
jgi:Uma2 family endonuclease